MNKIQIGKRDDGGAVQLDLDTLVDTRALIQASSGGGKSWLLRLIVEEAGKHQPVILIDPEGEYASLRERLEIVLVGEGGDMRPDPSTAGALAIKLLELGVSAVLDIFELPPKARREFVAKFLENLVAAPKALWRPTLVVVDEAHLFCPESGKGGGEFVSKEPVINLLNLGRKRGYCGLLATQRLSKLSKDAAAECRNKFIGMTNLLDDRKRAGEELSLPKDEWMKLRELSPKGREGEFYAFGPAIEDRGVVKFRSGPVHTSHGRKARMAAKPAPSAKIKLVLSELKALAEEANQEVRDLDGARRTIAELEARLAASGQAGDIAHQVAGDIAVMESRLTEAYAQNETLRRDVERLSGYADRMRQDRDRISEGMTRLAQGPFTEIHDEMVSLQRRLIDNTRLIVVGAVVRDDDAHQDPGRLLRSLPSVDIRPHREFTEAFRSGARPALGTAAGVGGDQGRSGVDRPVPTVPRGPSAELSRLERALLTVLAQQQRGISKGQVLTFAGYRASGDVSVAFGKLNSNGWTEMAADGLRITPAGLGALGDFKPLPTGAALRKHWVDNLGSPVERAILSKLFDLWPTPVTKGKILELIGYKASGDVSVAFGKLARMNLMEKVGGGVKAADDLFRDRRRP